MTLRTGPQADKLPVHTFFDEEEVSEHDQAPEVEAGHPALDVKGSSDVKEEAEADEEISASQEHDSGEEAEADKDEEVELAAHQDEDEEASAKASASQASSASEGEDEEDDEEEENANSASASKEASVEVESKEEKEETAPEPFEALGKTVASVAARKQQDIAAKAKADNEAAQAKNAADEKAAAAHAKTDAAVVVDQKLADAKAKHQDQAAGEERKRLEAEAKNRVDHSDVKKLADDAKVIADAKLPSIQATAQAALDAQSKANDEAAKAAAEHKKIDDEKHEALGKVVKTKSDFVTPSLAEPLGKVATARLTKRIADAVKAIEEQKTANDPVAATIPTGEKAEKPVKALANMFEKSKAEAKVKSELAAIKVEAGVSAAKDDRKSKVALSK